MEVEIKTGDILTFKGDAIVNPWNRNIVPWWLLNPGGVSGAIKKQGGKAIFKELRRHGRIPLGGAVSTSSGRLPFKIIIHVAGINLLGKASRGSISDSVRNAVRLAEEMDMSTLAFPVIGSGSGGFDEKEALGLMLAELDMVSSEINVTLFKFEAID